MCVEPGDVQGGEDAGGFHDIGQRIIGADAAQPGINKDVALRAMAERFGGFDDIANLTDNNDRARQAITDECLQIVVKRQ